MSKFSALRINGKRAYEYARFGKELPQELVPRSVNVSNLELVEWFDKHSFPAPEKEVKDDEKTPENVFVKKRLEFKPPEQRTTVTIGPACKLWMTVSGGFRVGNRSVLPTFPGSSRPGFHAVGRPRT